MKTRYVPFLLFAGYVLLCLCLPEFHPFSKYSMYNHFPNSAYAFYIKDEKGQIVHLRKHFRMGAAEMAHLYGSIHQKYGFSYGNGMEADSQLAVVGQEMLEFILAMRSGPLPFDTLSLGRMHWHFNGETLQKDEKQLYKTHVD